MAKRVITLRGTPIIDEESVAAVAITPGMLVNFDVNGDLVPHATADGKAPAVFAHERDEMGDDIDVAYAVGDTVKVGSYSPGQRVLAIVASGVNVAKGAFLTSAGTGKLKAGAGAGVIVGQAMEDLDNSAGPGDARIRVKIV